MPKFAVPLPDNLDEELALEDQRQQRRKATLNALSGRGSNDASRPASDVAGSRGGSFAASGNVPPGAAGSAEQVSNESVASKSSEDRLDIALLPMPVIAQRTQSGSNGGGGMGPSQLSGTMNRTTSNVSLKDGSIGSATFSGTDAGEASAAGGLAAMFGKTTSSIPPGDLSRTSSNASPQRVRMREVKAWVSFLHQKRECITVRLPDGSKGSDIVEAVIRTAVAQDERLRGRWSENARDYKLFTADDQTGEEEFLMNMDRDASKITSVLLKEGPGANLAKFPQQQHMLPAAVDDIAFQVNIIGAQGKRTVTLPPDLIVGHLVEVLEEALHLKDTDASSLLVHYGPVTIGLDQRFGFGPGGEGSEPLRVRDRTIQSLYRFGVKEFSIKAKLLDDAPPTPLDPATKAQAVFPANRSMNEEEAKMYRQFEVIKTNKYGLRQERLLGVDAETIYNMKPGTSAGKAKNPERAITDIKEIRVFPERPNYFEIDYVKDDTDKIETKTALDCSLLVEKLRILIKMHQNTKERTKLGGFQGFLAAFRK